MKATLLTCKIYYCDNMSIDVARIFAKFAGYSCPWGAKNSSNSIIYISVYISLFISQSCVM